VVKISYAGCLGLSQAISVQFNVERCDAAQNRKNITKTLILGVHNHSKSLILMLIKSTYGTSY